MHRLATFAAVLVPALTFAQESPPCAFTLGHSSLKGQSSAEPSKMVPHWFTVSGRAVVTIKGKALVAKLYDAAGTGEHTHTLNATLGSALGTLTPFKTRINATLTTLFSDGGNDALSGTFEVVFDPGGSSKATLQSLVVHNAYSFVALSCYG